MTLVAPSMTALHTSVTFPHHHTRYTPHNPPHSSAPSSAAQMTLDSIAAKLSGHAIDVRAPSPTTPPPIGSGRYTGMVKTFYPERGYGWMACPRAGRDVFVHANDLQSPESRNLLPFLPGTTLEFDIAQRPRGLSAINVVVLAVPQAAAPIVEGVQVVETRSRRHRPASENFVPSRPIAMGRRFQGTVVYYTSSKGYGFVQTNNLAGKVYVHIYAVEKFNVTELRLGMVLEFSVRENHKGKYACNVKLIHDVPTDDNEPKPSTAVSMWEGRYRGILKSFDVKRSLGWIQYRNSEVFMHIYEIRQDNAEDRLHLGVELEFSIGTHGRGPTAYDIDIIGTPSASTLRTIPMSQLVAIPTLGLSHSDSQSSDDGSSTPPPTETYSGVGLEGIAAVAEQNNNAGCSVANPLFDGLKRLGLLQQEMGTGQRPKVSLTTVALLAQLLEASGIETVADDDIYGALAQPQPQEDEADSLAADVLRLVGAMDESTADSTDPYWLPSNLTSSWLPTPTAQ